jgi:hypothetical protein
MAPAQFPDFSKSVTDVFDKNGFTADKKIKLTAKTAPVLGCPITVSTEVKGINDHAAGFGAKVSAKWKHACGFAVDKFDNDASKGTVLETSFSKFALKGLSVAANLNKTYGAKATTTYPLEVKYEDSMVAGSLSTAAPAFAAVTANLTLATEGLLVGTSLQFKGGATSPVDYPLSLSYTAPGYVAAVEATEKLKTFTLLGKYVASPQLTVAGKFLVPDGAANALTLGGTFAYGGPMNAKFAAMYSSVAGMKDEKKNKAAALECAVVANPLKGLETGFALAFPLANLGKYKYGITFALG